VSRKYHSQRMKKEGEGIGRGAGSRDGKEKKEVGT
jgi:hypothetical protein